MIQSTPTAPDPELLLATQMLAIDEVRIDPSHLDACPHLLGGG